MNLPSVRVLLSFHTWPTAEFPILLRMTILSYTSYISHENPILKYCNYSLSHYMYIPIYPAKIAYIYICISSKIRKNRKYTYTIIYNNIDLCIIYIYICIYMMLDYSPTMKFSPTLREGPTSSVLKGSASLAGPRDSIDTLWLWLT